MFEAGQVVRLKSGGSKMTIQEIEGTEALCVWHEKIGTRHETRRERFDIILLKKYVPQSVGSVSFRR